MYASNPAAGVSLCLDLIEIEINNRFVLSIAGMSNGISCTAHALFY